MKNVSQWILGALVLMTAVSTTALASDGITAPLPEADPTLLIAVGVGAVSFLAGVSKFRLKK